MSNNGGVYTFSQIAANNASADSTQNWAEGMAPSAVNDSARSLLASIAKFRDDISGAIVTTGTSAAYIVASNQVFDTVADFAGQVIAFSPHITNAAGPVTMTVDGFANLPLRTSPGVELLAGTIIQGTPYVAVYNNTDGALYLQGFFGNPYNVPLLAGMDFWGPTAPNSSFVFPFGQAISRITYAKAFALIGTQYGVGDGSTTFNLPDKNGRLSACLDNMGGVDRGRLGTGSMAAQRNSLGGAGGAPTHTLIPAEIPSINSVNNAQPISVTVMPQTGGIHIPVTNGNVGDSADGSGTLNAPFSSLADWTMVSSFSGTTNNSIAVTSNNTGGGAHDNLQPTILCNYIMRII
jgi:microcystin-dependent protein